MAISGRSVHVESAGAIVLLSHETVYYVYFDDPQFGSRDDPDVTYNASISAVTAGFGGRFFVGSIRTPAKGGRSTIGNGDGGTPRSITDTRTESGISAPASVPNVMNLESGVSRARPGRPAKLSPQFVSHAGKLWRDAQSRRGRANVSQGQLQEIASRLDAEGYTPPADYLEKSAAAEVRQFNSSNSRSQTGAIMTWSKLISIADKHQLRAMRRLLSRCAEK